MKKAILIFTCLILLVPSFASAQSSTRGLPELQTKITAASKADPGLFKTYDELRDHVVELDKKKRGPFLPLGAAFTALGPDAVLPLANMMLTELEQPSLTGSARVTMFVGVAEALANLQQSDVVPVLFEVLNRETEQSIVAAATEAIGRLGNDEDIADLLRNVTNDDVTRGLRGCRRVACASFLIGKLDSAEGSTQLITIKTMGSVANTWAWQTSEVQSKDDGNAVRGIVARALIARYTSFGPSAQKTARKSILLANFDGSARLIAAQRANASETERAALDALAERVANNPLK